MRICEIYKMRRCRFENGGIRDTVQGIYMYICTYVLIASCMCAWMYVCDGVWRLPKAEANSHELSHVSMHVCVCVCMDVCVHGCMCVMVFEAKANSDGISHVSMHRRCFTSSTSELTLNTCVCMHVCMYVCVCGTDLRKKKQEREYV